MDIHNIDEYLDLQDQTDINLLSTEDQQQQRQGEEEEEWHSAVSLNLLPKEGVDWNLLQSIKLPQNTQNQSDAYVAPDSLVKQPAESVPVVQEKRMTRARAAGKAKTPPPATAKQTKKKKTRAKKLYCICQKPYDGEPMVQCDKCKEWFHCTCVGFDAENQNEDDIDWICDKCKQATNDNKDTQEHTVEQPVENNNTEEQKPINPSPPATTRQTRAKSQSKCLYAGCSNSTRADSFCSDVCARKHSESTSAQEKPRTTRRVAMRTAAQSAAPKKESDNKQHIDPENESESEEQDTTYNEKEDDEDEYKEEEPKQKQKQKQKQQQQQDDEDEDVDEEEEEEETGTSTGPTTPMSPSQMTEQENPVRRNVIKNMTAVLKAIFEKAMEENAEMLDSSDLGTLERAEELAKSIEKTMIEQLGDTKQGQRGRTCGEPYKSKFRSLLYNLKDKANKVFQLRVVTGDLTPEELVKMSSEDMANPELKSMSEVFRKVGLKNSVMKIDNTPIIKKTHKGDIIMVPNKDNDATQNMYSEQVQQQLEKIDSHQPTETKKPTLSSFSPTSNSNDPLDDILARIGIPTQDEPFASKRSGSMSEDTAEVDPEAKRRKVTEDVEKLLGDEDDTFMVEDVDTTDLKPTDDENKEGEEDKEEEILPTIWQGRVNMPQVAEFEASARQIGGRLLSENEWQDVLSPTMWIEGRIPSERVTNYVTQTQYSTSREIILLEVEAKGGDANQQAQVLLDYLESRQRYAVVGHNKTRVKDFYLIPLYKAQHIPDCLYVVRVEETKRKCDLFLGVLVLTKHSVKQPVAIPSLPLQPPPPLPPQEPFYPSYGYGQQQQQLPFPPQNNYRPY